MILRDFRESDNLLFQQGVSRIVAQRVTARIGGAEVSAKQVERAAEAPLLRDNLIVRAV
jgi:hypothetical protein